MIPSLIKDKNLNHISKSRNTRRILVAPASRLRESSKEVERRSLNLNPIQKRLLNMRDLIRYNRLDMKFRNHLRQQWPAFSLHQQKSNLKPTHKPKQQTHTLKLRKNKQKLVQNGAFNYS